MHFSGRHPRTCASRCRRFIGYIPTPRTGVAEYVRRTTRLRFSTKLDGPAMWPSPLDCEHNCWQSGTAGTCVSIVVADAGVNSARAREIGLVGCGSATCDDPRRGTLAAC